MPKGSADDVECDLGSCTGCGRPSRRGRTARRCSSSSTRRPSCRSAIVRDLFAGDFVSAQGRQRGAPTSASSAISRRPRLTCSSGSSATRRRSRCPRHGVEREIQSTLDRRVDLPSGGYLDARLRRGVHGRRRQHGTLRRLSLEVVSQRLEDTITKNNLEAVKEVVRQLRLRDIGGIIVIDFIDMANPKNRAQVEEALRTELERDRTKTYVVEISPLGLVEMTRQNVTDGPREILTRKCPTCAGDGIVVSDQTMAMQVERRLRRRRSRLARSGLGSRCTAHPGAGRRPGGERLAASRRRRAGTSSSGRADTSHGSLRGARRGQARRSAAGRAGRGRRRGRGEARRGRSARRGGGGRKVDGLDVVVAERGKLVGKKAKVVIGRVLDGQAFATLVERRPPPTSRSRSRARRRSRPARSSPRKAVADEVRRRRGPDDTTGEEAEEWDDALDPDAEGADDDELEESADATPTPKKRTRRGSRGGRRRRKPPVEGGEDVASGEDVVDELELEPGAGAAGR